MCACRKGPPMQEVSSASMSAAGRAAQPQQGSTAGQRSRVTVAADDQENRGQLAGHRMGKGMEKPPLHPPKARAASASPQGMTTSSQLQARISVDDFGKSRVK